MKNILLSLFVLVCLLSAGCRKNNDDKCLNTGSNSGAVQVIKDCTGTYIRYQQKDYRVCNEELLKNKASSAWINTSFNKVASCIDMPAYVCNMYHANEGFVEITCIR